MFFSLDMSVLSFPSSLIADSKDLLKMKQEPALSPVASPLPDTSLAAGASVIQLTLGPSMSMLNNCRTTTDEKNYSPKEVTITINTHTHTRQTIERKGSFSVADGGGSLLLAIHS